MGKIEEIEIESSELGFTRSVWQLPRLPPVIKTVLSSWLIWVSMAKWVGWRKTRTAARTPKVLWPDVKSVLVLGTSYALPLIRWRFLTTKIAPPSQSMPATKTITT